MAAITYLDFDLSIEPIAGSRTRFRARVLNSPAGQASAEFRLPFSRDRLENYILKMGRTRQGVRGLNSSEGRAAQEFGGLLYDAVFRDQVRDCLRSSLNLANQQPDHGLRIRLRLTEAKALADLPWEYLYDAALRRFFVHSVTTPIVRFLDLPQPTPPLTVQLPLNVLVMIANPRDAVQLDVEAEWNNVQTALADPVARGLVTVTRLAQATLTALHRQLRRGQYHIFHFIGHGRFDQLTQEGVLGLEDDNGLLRLVDGSQLGALLHDHRSLRLAVLNSCEGARTGPNDPFAGIAQTLVQQGIPAVIAMQFEITDGAAITLAHEFYTALADGDPVDTALTEARKAIYAAGNDVEWGTPVLYMRAVSGRIFETPKRGPLRTVEHIQAPDIGALQVPPIIEVDKVSEREAGVDLSARTVEGEDITVEELRHVIAMVSDEDSQVSECEVDVVLTEQTIKQDEPDIEDVNHATATASSEANLTYPNTPQQDAGTGSLPDDILLHGRYTIVAKLAQGGMTAIYKVVDNRLPGKIWALKEMSLENLDPSEVAAAIQDFHREAELLSKLDHPNLVKVFDRFTAGRKEYLVMECIEGETLEDRVGVAVLSEPEVLNIAFQLCAVLEYLHQQTPPIIYRDLKPGNIMIETSSGLIKLIDFSIVRFYKPGQHKDTRPLGTPGFAPPEQYGKGQTDVRSDIFALGVTLLVLLTAYDVTQNPWAYPPARQLNPQVSDRLEQVIVRAIKLKVSERYQSITEMRNALQTCKGARTISATLPWYHIIKWWV